MYCFSLNIQSGFWAKNSHPVANVNSDIHVFKKFQLIYSTRTFKISCDIPSMRSKANTMDKMLCTFKYQLYDNTTDIIGFYTVYNIDSYMQFNHRLFIKQGQNIRFPEQSKNTERKKRKSFFMSLCKKVQLVSVLSFSFKNAIFKC